MEAKATRPGPRRIFRRGAWEGEGQGRRDAARHAAAAIARRPGEAPGASALEAGAERLRGAVLERAAESLCVLALDDAGCHVWRRCRTCKRRSRAKPSCRIRSALPCEERRQPRPAAKAGPCCFDPRSRARSDTNFHCDILDLYRFDPRSRARSDPPGDCGRRREGSFDPRSRARSDVTDRRSRPPNRCFDPRSRARSDHPNGWRCHVDERFDPRSRARSDEGGRRRATSGTVSIRAPVRGATLQAECERLRLLFRSALPCEERRWQARRG